MSDHTKSQLLEELERLETDVEVAIREEQTWQLAWLKVKIQNMRDRLDKMENR
jgi:hypothetical protein